MGCKILNKKKDRGFSLLADELQKIHKLSDSQQDIDYIAKIYSYFFTPHFLEQFGNWVKEDLVDDSNNNRINEAGEPSIFEEDNTYYSLDKGLNKMFIPINEYKRLLDIGITNLFEFRQDVANQTLYYIFKERGLKPGSLDFNKLKDVNISKSIRDYFTETKKSHLTKLRKSKTFTPEKEAKISNMYDTYIDLSSFFEKDVEDFLAKIDISLEDSNETISQKELEDNALGLDLKSSFIKNNKDNAQSKVKLLVSFLPHFKRNGQALTSKYLFSQKFVPFDKVWQDLLPILTNVPKTLGLKNKVRDPFKVITERLNVAAKHKPYLKVLSNILESIDVDTQTQFTNTFSNLSPYSHTSIEIDGEERSRKIKMFDATQATKKSNKTLNEWSINFKNLFIIDTPEGFEFNKDKYQQAVETFEEFLNDKYSPIKRKFKTDLSYSAKTLLINNVLRQLNNFGINVSTEEFGYFLADNGVLSNTSNKILFETIDDVFNSIVLISKRLKSTKNTTKMLKNGYTTVYKEFSTTRQVTIDKLAEAVSSYDYNMSEDSIISGDVVKWKYSLTNYLNDLINIWKNNPDELDNKLAVTFNKNSAWIPSLLSGDNLDKFKVVIANTFQEVNKAAEGTNNVETKKVDALVRDIHEALSHKTTNNLPTYQTPVPADKSTSIKMTIDYFLDTGARYEDNEFVISDEVLEVYLGYFEDEYINAIYAKQDILRYTDKDGNVDTTKLDMYHHTNKDGYVFEVINADGSVILDENDNPYFFNNLETAREVKNRQTYAKIKMGGNAFKSSLLPSLSPENIGDKIQKGVLYRHDVIGLPSLENSESFTDSQRLTLLPIIKDIIENSIIKEIEYFKSRNIIDQVGNNKNIDIFIWQKYNSDVFQLVGDYLINTTIAQVEYQKLFSGPLSYHKDISDYFKRISGTYIDGSGLRLGMTKNDHLFNVAVIEDSIVDSIHRTNMSDVSQYYTNINQADAQAYITPKRWKFLVERLGKWSPIHEDIYNNILEGRPLDANEIKLLSTKPLKGVYRSLINGKPVYLKYSQAVLIPKALEKTPLGNLLSRMERDNIDEVVFTSAIKIGAKSLNSDPVEAISEFDEKNENDYKLNKITLDNRFWKLQQDLPIKGIKPIKLGSQIQKNILLNLQFTKKYDNQTGLELYKELNNLISGLSDFGLADLMHDFGIGTDNYTIKDWTRFKDSILDQLTKQKIPENIINAIKKELTPFVVPQARNKLISIIYSIINKAVIDVETNGAALIQMSNYGFDSITAINAGVYMIEPVETLAEPIKVQIDGRTTVLPGQVFVSSTFISKYIPNWRDYTPEELFGEEGMVDERILELVGYRIPNQGMSSNDALKIVGILPDSYEDTIIPYTGITTKTGSDFDIDKMYMIMPHMELDVGQKLVKDAWKLFNTSSLKKNRIIEILKSDGYTFIPEQYKNVFVEDFMINSNHELAVALRDKMGFAKYSKLGELRLKYIEYDSSIPVLENSKKAVQNRILELYKNVLTSPHNYKDLMSPLDSPFFKENIKEINNITEDVFGDLEVFSSTRQIELKYEYLAGAYGIGQIANHLVDHSRGQTSDFTLPIYLGWGNSIDVPTVKGSKSVTIFDKNDKGEFNSEKFSQLKTYQVIKIVNSISAVLNGYVDITKDTFITKGNWNTLTSNMGMMLIRAGVHPFKVNVFLSQPILKELVVSKNVAEAKASDYRSSRKIEDDLEAKYLGKLEDALKELEYPNDEISNILVQVLDPGFELINIGGRDIPNRITSRITNSYNAVIENIKNPNESADFIIDQLLALKEYKFLIKYTKEFRLQVETAKSGEVGAGKNPINTMIIKNKVASLLKSPYIDNVESRYYNEYMDKTFLATYYNNSVGFASKLVEDNPKLFITFTEQFRDFYNYVSDESSFDRKYLDDEDIGYVIENGIYTTIMSEFAPFKIENNVEEFNDMFVELYEDISKLKDQKIDNFLIEQIDLKLDHGFQFIGVDNMRQHPPFYDDQITQGWTNLFTSHPEIAKKIVKYSFYQSGFKSNANQMFTYIPNEYFIENNINSFFDDVISNISDIDFKAFSEKLYRHNWNNSKIVPRIRKENILEIGRDAEWMILKSGSNRHIGISEEGLQTYAPFMSKYRARNIDLYQLEGYVLREEKGYEAHVPVYFKTNKLGFRSLKGQFQEYGFDDMTSIYEGNKLTEKVMEEVTRFKEEIKQEDKYLSASEVKLDHEVLSNPIEFTKEEPYEEKSDTENPFECKE